jgi:hypothetical protein
MRQFLVTIHIVLLVSAVPLYDRDQYSLASLESLVSLRPPITQSSDDAELNCRSTGSTGEDDCESRTQQGS